MQAIAADQPADPNRRAPSTNGLINLAAPVLELVLKLRTGTIPPSNDVRPVVDDLLKQVEQGAASLGYSYQHAQHVKFALVAFVDETVLNPANQFPLRDEWEKKPLQLEHFSEHLAGVKFFERLNEMAGDIDANVDVVEVYYVCLLLGYRGKYNIHLLEEQFQQIIRSVAERLRRAGRLRPNTLSSHWLQEDQPTVQRPRGLPLWFKIAAPSALGLVMLTYLVLYVVLQRYSGLVVR